MKAVIQRKYGSPEVLKVMEIEKPSPKEDEVLIRIYATSVSSGDCRLRKADPFIMRLFFGLLGPKKSIPGVVFSGEIIGKGKNVKQFKKGDQVFGSAGLRFGAYAEFICLPANGILAIKPDNMNYEEAASIPFGGLTALYFIKKANIMKGQKVLIYGASGAVGTAAVQLAKYFGAEVTAVCGSTNVELVRSLGADKIIDYTKVDIAKICETFDVIFETTGKISFSRIKRSLQSNGILILGSAGLGGMIKGYWTSKTSHQKVKSGMIAESVENLIFLKRLIEKGSFRAIVDRTYGLDQIADAHAYVDKGHKKGNVAIRI